MGQLYPARGVKVNARQKRHINRGKNNAGPYVTQRKRNNNNGNNKNNSNEKEKKSRNRNQAGAKGNATGYECAEQLALGKSIEVATTTN